MAPPVDQRAITSIANTRLGRYWIKRSISARSTGRVYAAFDPLIGRRVAVNVLRPELSADARLLDEARAAATIADPGIVQVFDIDQHLGGSTFVVTELLEGELLENRLRRAGVVPIEDALPFIRQVASTLGAAHARGIVHRGLEPATIFIARDPEAPTGERAKLLDFGIASFDRAPLYMSPELRSGGRVDAGTDVYSLGCVLFTLLTGAPPLASSDRAGVSAEVDELLARCLATDPAKRFASGAALATAIDRVLALGERETRPTRRMRSAVCTLSELTGQVKLQAREASAAVRVLAGVTALAVASAITMAVI